MIMNSTTGELIRVARRALGMTQEQLAVAAGLKQGPLSRYETGAREPDEAALGAIATALQMNAKALRDGSPFRAPLAVDAHMRRRATTRVTDWTRSESELNFYRFQVSRLFDAIDMTPTLSVPSLDPMTTPAAEGARLVRQQWKMPIGPVDQLMRWIEAAGIIVILKELPTPRIDGLSQWIGKVPVCLVNRSAPTDRRRWTLAHELGHLVLHSGEAVTDPEQEANEFAAEFLMPETVIRPSLRNLTIDKLLPLKQQWGVSMQALIQRAFGLHVMTSEERTRMYKRFSARGWRKREPGSESLAPESPELLIRVAHGLTARGLDDTDIEQITGVACGNPLQILPRPQPRLRAL